MKDLTKQLNAATIYDELLRIHSLNWLKNYQEMNTIQYIEFNGGPLIAHFVNTKVNGVTTVVNDLNRKISELLR
jgi:Fe2+ or Zn2+ uptake regulation protein